MSTRDTLEAAAFGRDPGRWPLTTAAGPQERWLRAVAAGGQGRYGVATSELAALRRAMPRGPLASLAYSTHGSFLRQLGGHDAARVWDGRALALAGDDPEATVDALLGLAADALGVGRLTASAALLERAVAGLDAPSAPARLPIRSQWVAAELAMARGDGATAVAHAEQAAELALRQPSARHQVKSQVVYAAALCCAGRRDESRSTAEGALAAAEQFALVPLGWAVASLLCDIAGGAVDRKNAVAVRDAGADFVRRAGGAWRR
jgi:tetratricopeptide (TPR) repeat protein